MSGCSSNSAYPLAFDEGDDDACPGAKRCKSNPPDSEPVDLTVVTLATGEDVACMTVDVDAAYWVRRDGSIAALPTTDVPSTGRPAIAESSVRAEVGAGPCELVRDGSYLWVTAFKDGVVRRLSVRKNADRTVSFGEGALTFGGFETPSSIAVDAASVYVAEYDGGTIRRFAKPPGDAIADAGADAGPGASTPADAGSGTGSAPEALAVLGTQAGRIVLDDESLYWLSYTSADAATGVRRVAKSGGEVTTLAVAGKELQRKALHRIGGSLYFLDERSRVQTVSTRGGLATPVMEGGAAAFTSDGTSLFIASGNRMAELGLEGNRALFPYAATTPNAGTFEMFAQPGRLVWAMGGNIATRVTR